MKTNIRKPDMSPNKTPMPMQEAAERTRNTDETALGYTAEQAMAEAGRCMDCPDRWCAEACPAHVPIPEFAAQIRAGDFKAAYELISKHNSMPEISSRVCPQERQCESRCTRAIRSEAVAIGRLERFVADWHNTNSNGGHQAAYIPRYKLDKKVAVVGSGPAGQTCALSLAKSGFRVTVFEKSGKPGGIPAWGIPGFVLPVRLPEKQIAALLEAGVEIKTGMALGTDVTLDNLCESYDAVFVAVGAGKPVPLAAEGANVSGVVQAADYLAAGDKPTAKNVVVIGGGSTAIDAARAAVRTGAVSVKVLYRRSEAEMPATAEELTLSKDEGVEFVYLVNPARFIESGGRLGGVECDKMEFAAPDYPGGRRNVKPSGASVVIEAELAVLALGFENVHIDGLESDSRNRIITGEDFRTSVPGVYAGGDAVTGAATLIKAVAAGKDAAVSIFADLT